MMKGIFSVLWMAPGMALGELAPMNGHIDILPRYLNGQWSWSLDAPSPIGLVAAGQHYFPGVDGDFFADEGIRFTRPEGDFWDILGVAEEEPLWIFPESIPSGYEGAWLGLGDTQTGVFSGVVRLSLLGVDGPPGGHFTMFRDDGAVIFATADGITAADAFNKPAFHTHVSWGFSKKGLWRVRIVASAFLGPGQTNPTGPSPASPLYFAIGNQARWRAEQFDAAVVMNDAIAGSDADPDADGLVNALEYVLGGDPNSGSGVGPVHGGSIHPQAGMNAGKLTITFHRRQDSSSDMDLQPIAEWAYSLNGPWIPGGTVLSVVPLAGGWERVTLRDASGDVAKFARIRAVPVP
ncbi:MAG: hypothetical protein MUF31_08395 [Akkermansiaceae bacterium]|nr:hypothetical protein [Akkermansiaceae bacterium]